MSSSLMLLLQRIYLIYCTYTTSPLWLRYERVLPLSCHCWSCSISCLSGKSMRELIKKKKSKFLWENEANERALFELDVINAHWSRQTALDGGLCGRRVLSFHCSLLVSELIRTVLCCGVKWSPCGQLIRRLVTYSTQTAHLRCG